jgi:hypothetical protein
MVQQTTKAIARKIGLVFISQAWSLEFPGTMAKTLTRDTSDHVHYAIIIKTEVPKIKIFRFENYCLEHKTF